MRRWRGETMRQSDADDVYVYVGIRACGSVTWLGNARIRGPQKPTLQQLQVINRTQKKKGQVIG